MASAAGLIASSIAAVFALLAAYLLFLSAVGLARPARAPARSAERRRFAVLVPAHDEAAVIARLVRNLKAQRYPRENVDIVVVADNCVDRTAEIARAEGAVVYERMDADRRAKGYALGWLLDRLRSRGGYDAYVVVDADSELSTDFLACMDARLEAGAQVIQSHYRVRNADSSGLAALRDASLASLHYLRPLGRAALGLSCGLKGNGMCFAAAVLDRFGWQSAGLAEDVELHLALVGHGVRTHFAPEATVRADMPETYDVAATQNLRWEAGRLSALRRQVGPLVAAGLRGRSAMALDAAIEQLVPPLSIGVSAGLACAGAGLVVGNVTAVALGSFAAAGYAVHVVLGMIAVGAPLRSYRALLGAPAYVAWKIALYGRALIASPAQPWVRTRREDARPREP